MQMIMQMMQSGGNPQQILIQMLERQPNNPIIQNLLQKVKDNDLRGATDIMKNVSSERGINFDQAANDFKNRFRL